ncbi:uncharacterized protein C8orf88 homolog isoform X2 [Vanacampus margaritifer]
MEVSRRPILRRNLEPARPLRRLLPVDISGSTEGTDAAAPCGQSLFDIVAEKSNITVEQFLKIVNLQDQKKDNIRVRLCYTRDFLIGLASCPAARKRPEFLPEHAIVLTHARDPNYLWVNETNGNKETTGDGEPISSDFWRKANYTVNWSPVTAHHGDNHSRRH